MTLSGILSQFRTSDQPYQMGLELVVAFKMDGENDKMPLTGIEKLSGNRIYTPKMAVEVRASCEGGVQIKVMVQKFTIMSEQGM
jgi:hypothetical protein